jgi:hypothetical protein
MISAASTDDSVRRKRSETAEQIALEASRLMRLAAANNFTMLAHLIDMAVLEAWREASESGDPENSARAHMLLDGT